MALAMIDLAIGPDGLTALVPGREQPVRVPGRLGSGAGSGSDDPGRLGEAFVRLEQAVKEALGVGLDSQPSFLVRVALLPPLTEVRLVDLPGLRSEEIEPVI